MEEFGGIGEGSGSALDHAADKLDADRGEQARE